MDFLWDQLEQAKTFLLVGTWLVAIAIVIFFLLKGVRKVYKWAKVKLSWPIWMRRLGQKTLRLWHRRRVLMSLKQRRAAALRIIYADVITNALEDLAFRKIISEKELKKAYKQWGRSLRLPTLIAPSSVFLRISPRSKRSYPIPDQLKGEIRERVENGHNNPVRLPDDDRPDGPLAATFTNRI